MTELTTITPILQNIIYILSNSLHAELAIIDSKYNLIAYSNNYLKYKGKDVHIPFVQKVFDSGEIVASKPGKMDICEGCRFQNHCPAKTEILDCIKLQNNPIGTISISNFNKNFNNKNIIFYEKTLTQTCDLIKNILENKNITEEENKNIIKNIFSLSEECFFYTDHNGNIINYNDNSNIIRQHKKLDGKNINKILPIDQQLVANTDSQQNKNGLKIHGKKYSLSFRKINNKYMNGNFIIKLSTQEDKKNKDNNNKKNYTYISQDPLTQIKGISEKINSLKNKTKKIARSPSSVLIKGETGTGKELFARAIHYHSARYNKPFIAINCASIPESLLESELFGYEKGSFTGARKDGKMGILEQANGGTIFLDEIGDMPYQLQAKLLRVLQEQTIRKIGSNKIISIDIRIISATNKNIDDMIKAKDFRADLYYRLNVINLNIPPLRKRKKDIMTLAYYFLNQVCHKFNFPEIDTFSKKSRQLLKNYDWPGNIRELQNAVEHAVTLEESNIIQATNLPTPIKKSFQKKEEPLHSDVNKYEKNLIEKNLNTYGSDLSGKKKTANKLDISLRTLYRKIKKYEIEI